MSGLAISILVAGAALTGFAVGYIFGRDDSHPDEV